MADTQPLAELAVILAVRIKDDEGTVYKVQAVVHDVLDLGDALRVVVEDTVVVLVFFADIDNFLGEFNRFVSASGGGGVVGLLMDVAQFFG